jgi:hypothetical protein
MRWFPAAAFYALCITCATHTHAGSLPLEFSWSNTFASQYLFQGYDLSGRHGVAQPEVSLSYGGLAAGIWCNHDIVTSRTNEYDYSVGFSRPLGQRLSLGLSYMFAEYPNRDWPATQEAILDAEVDAFLSPSLSLHYDFDEGDGLYATLSLSRDIGIGGRDLTAGLCLHHQRRYFGMTGIPSIQWDLTTTIGCAGLDLVPGITRIQAFENGDFDGDLSVPDTWLVSLSITPSSEED